MLLLLLFRATGKNILEVKTRDRGTWRRFYETMKNTVNGTVVISHLLLYQIRLNYVLI